MAAERSCRAALTVGSLLAVLMATGVASGDAPPTTFVPRLGIDVPDEKLAAVGHALAPGGSERPGRAAVTAAVPTPIAPHVLPADVPVPLPPRVIVPVVAWLASDGRNLVAVYGGAAGDDPGRGRFVVVRQTLVAGTQRVHVVDVGETGAVAITRAPGPNVAPASALAADLRFEARNGRTGTLQLKSDLVVLDP